MATIAAPWNGLAGATSVDSCTAIVERYRKLCCWMVLASVGAAIVLASQIEVLVDARGFGFMAWGFAAILVVAILSGRTGGLLRVADMCGAVGLIWTAGISCGALALLDLRFHLPLQDRTLLAVDRFVGFDGLAVSSWLLAQGQWIFTAMAAAYSFTIPLLMLSVAVLALAGQRVEAWRGGLCFVGSLLSTCAVSMLTPAKGLGLWAPQSLLDHLPDKSMRYFWTHFDAFYAGDMPMLSLSALDGVISFPSFHAAMGLIVVALWRRSAWTLALSLIWFAFMLLGTVPFGGHYGVDLIGGLGIAWGWLGISRRLQRAITANCQCSAPLLR